MRITVIRVSFVSWLISLCLAFTWTTAFGQCGPSGTLPCGTAIKAPPKKATLKRVTAKKTTAKIKSNTKSISEKDNKAFKEHIEIVIKEDGGVTSELTLIPISVSLNLISAKFGAMYFGPQSESDISIIFLLMGTKERYSTGETFGVKFYADDMPPNSTKVRLINSVKNEEGGELLQFNIKLEELAWLANAKKLSFRTFNVDADANFDTLTFTNTGLAEFKEFAKSVFLIKSRLQ